MFVDSFCSHFYSLLFTVKSEGWQSKQIIHLRTQVKLLLYSQTNVSLYRSTHVLVIITNLLPLQLLPTKRLLLHNPRSILPCLPLPPTQPVLLLITPSLRQDQSTVKPLPWKRLIVELDQDSFKLFSGV